MARPLYLIAKDIGKYWPNPYFGARPYIIAMESLDSIDDFYMQDSARSIVLYFLANAATWRGDKARQIKEELKELTK